MSNHHRHSIRLPGYDYSSPGFYFITICTHQRECIFGEIHDGYMNLNEYGKIVQQWLQNIEVRFPNVFLDEYSIMPNHIHAIILIADSPMVGVIHESPLPLVDTTPSSILRRKMLLPKIIGYFKMNSAKEINILRQKLHQPLWQRNYYEHIIRNEKSLNIIRIYIKNNPLKWFADKDNPTNWKKL